MKQTNNAIKFLMAQYRAIFKNANIAMAVALATAALAAGQAQAANLTLGQSADKPSSSQTVSGTVTYSGSKGYTSDIIISGKANSLSVSGASGHLFVGNTVNVSNSGSLTLSGSYGIIGSFDESFDDKVSSLNVNAGSVTVSGSQIQMNSIHLTDATVNLTKGIGDNNNSDWKDNALINAEVAWKDGKVVEGTGVLTVDGATGTNAKTITLGSGSQLVAATMNFNGGKLAMSGASGANSGALVQAYTEGNQSIINLAGTDVSANGSGNYIAGRNINITAGNIEVAASSELHLSGALDTSTSGAIATAQTAGTIDVTGGKLAVNGALVVEGKTDNKGSTLTIASGTELSGSGSITLGEKARLNIDKGVFDTFVNDTNKGKVVFSAASSQFKFETTETVDLSKYTYGSGDGADFDIESGDKVVIGKIIGDSLAISKAVSGKFSNEKSGSAIKVEADNLTLGAADAESKLSTIQGSVFTQLTAHDKLTLAGKDNKFTLDKGDMFLVNSDATKSSVIDGAALNLESGRLVVKGAWTSDSDITFTGDQYLGHANIFFQNSNAGPTSLTLTGTLTNDKTNNYGAIIAGDTKVESVLDVTGATLASSANANSLVYLTAHKNGKVIITGEQASAIAKGEANTSGFAVAIKSGGSLDIQGELAADFDDFISFTGNGSDDANNIVIASGAGTIKVDKANITGSGDFDLHSAGLEASELTLADGNLKSGSLTVTSQLNVGKFTVADKGSVSLTGTGSVSGESLTVNGSGASLDVDGSWTVDAGLTTSGSGSVTVDNGSSLTVNGALDIVDNSVHVTGGSTITADYSKATGTNGYTGGKLDVDETSSLQLTNFGSGSITLDELKKQKEAFLGSGADVSGLFSVTGQNGANVAVEGTKAENGKVTFTEAKEAANLAGIYDNVTVVDVNSAVTATNDWGAVQLAAGTNTLSVGKGAIHFNGVAGSDKLVSDSTGAVAGVSLTDSGSALVINGSGQMGDIAASADGNGSILVKDNVQLTAANVGATGTAVKSVDVFGSLVADGVASKTLTVDGGSVNVANAVSAENATIKGDVTAGSLAATKSLNISAGAVVDVGTLNTTNVEVNVGEDLVDNGSASVYADTYVFKGGKLIVDPEYGQAASKVVIQNITDDANKTDVQTVSGDVLIGKNSVVSIGYTQSEFDSVMADYLVDNGGFNRNGPVKNALVLNKPVTIADGKGIVLNAEQTGTQLQVTADTVTMGANSALILSDAAFGANKTGPAIKFADTGNSGAFVANTDSKVVLVGDFDATDTNLMLAQKANNTFADGMANLNVEYAGGILLGKYDATTGTFALEYQADKAAAIYSGISRPVGDLIASKLQYGNDGFNTNTLGWQFFVDSLSTNNYKAIDAAAHAATYAGAQQAAVASVTTMADAVVGRVGTLGVEAASISATGSQANGGVWVTPMYKSMDSDGFDAQGASYGSDIDLSGVAFGADTVNGNMRFGAVFNLGSGDADGKGNGSGLKDEFDYYGFGIYSAMGFGNFALVGDASLTVINHDVEGLGLNGEADTSAVTMGVTGQYTFATPMVDVTPHLGVRFIRLDTDSYDLNSAAGTIATTDFEVQSVFSVPLGVTLSKAFTSGGWALAPSADFTLTFNTGDTEAESTTNLAGKNIGLNTEVLDEVQYGLTLGASAQYGAFGTTFGVNYTGSSNTDSFGVNAQARYVF